MTDMRGQALLTIAIPTYKRGPFLRELLDALVPQLSELARSGDPGRVELLISNNSSPDNSHEIVESFRDRIPRLAYLRNTENIGSDNNFIQCFHRSSGRFFYLLGDDDVLMSGGLRKIVSLLERLDPDILYLSSAAFTDNFASQSRPDPLLRGYRVINDAKTFATLVNMMFVFISCIIVNKDRLLSIGAPPIEEARGSHLIQLSWILPLLGRHRSSICVFERLLAGRVNNGGYFNIATVSGVNLPREAARLLGEDSPITRSLVSAALRRWFPSEIMALREKQLSEELKSVEATLDPLYHSNWLYIVFARPFFRLPMGPARFWLACTRSINKLLYIANLPDFWRSRKDY